MKKAINIAGAVLVSTSVILVVAVLLVKCLVVVSTAGMVICRKAILKQNPPPAVWNMPRTHASKGGIK